MLPKPRKTKYTKAHKGRVSYTLRSSATYKSAPKRALLKAYRTPSGPVGRGAATSLQCAPAPHSGAIALRGHPHGQEHGGASGCQRLNLVNGNYGLIAKQPGRLSAAQI
jgi:hypothetical protein